MKTFGVALVALLAGAEAHHHHHPHFNRQYLSTRGIDEEDLMDGAHWRKKWPEGIDDGNDDEEILNMGRLGRKKKKDEEPEPTYPWTLEPEMVDSAKHLEDVEKSMNRKFEESGW